MHCMGMVGPWWTGLSIAYWVGVIGLGVLAVGVYVRNQKPTRSPDPKSPSINRG
jgi:hypothetical protein